MSEYKFPTNTPTQLWINGAGDSKAFERLLEPAMEHFGLETLLSQLEIEYVRWENEAGCSCCRDSGTYSDYYLITLKDTPDEYTADITLAQLVK